MKEEVINYLRKKGYLSTDASAIPYSVREIINNETPAQKEAFLMSEGFWEADHGEPKASNLTDEEYSLVRTAFELKKMREKSGSKFLKNIPTKKQLLLGDKIRRFLIIYFDILFLALLGMVIGNYEFFTGDYSADFNMHDAVQFWCYSAMFMYCVNRFANRVCDARSKETKNDQ